MADRDPLSSSPDRWRATRDALNQDRHGLALAAAQLYRDLPRVAGTHLLGRHAWSLDTPIDMDRVVLSLSHQVAPPLVDGTGPLTEHLRADGDDGALLPSYAATIGEIARPRVFANRPAYRLLTVEFSGNRARLEFGLGSYFDGVNVGEAAAHELAATGDEYSMSALPLRAAVGDPTDFSRRPALPAVSALTIRHDRSSGPSCVLHWRDPARVAHGGGLYQVMPVGVFQPVNDAPGSVHNDFDLWRGLVREYAEEFLGRTEDYGDAEPFDYDHWPLFHRFTEARNSGQVRVRLLGLGVDPLTFATDLLVAVVIESDIFDQLFNQLVATNDEGTVISADGMVGVPFTDATIRAFGDGTRPMQAAGLAALKLAAQHRESLLA